MCVGCEGVLGCEDGIGEKGGFMAADHVYVGGLDVVGVQEAHYACDHHAPVAALGYCPTSCQLAKGDNMRYPRRGTIFVVSKLEHELVTRLGILGQAKPFLLGAGGKAEVGKRKGDDMEGWCIFAACGQEREDFSDFEEAARP